MSHKEFETSAVEYKMDKESEEFISSMDYFASNKKDFAFRTNTPESAAIVISKILEYANREVKMYEDCLNGDIADKHPIFYATLNQFLLDGKILKMILRDSDPKESLVFDKLMEASELFPGQVDIRKANDRFKANTENLVEDDLNFTINDNNALRLEITTHNFNNSKNALCNFNNKKLADKLSKLFDQDFEECSKQQLHYIHD